MMKNACVSRRHCKYLFVFVKSGDVLSPSEDTRKAGRVHNKYFLFELFQIASIFLFPSIIMLTIILMVNLNITKLIA